LKRTNDDGTHRTNDNDNDQEYGTTIWYSFSSHRADLVAFAIFVPETAKSAVLLFGGAYLANRSLSSLLLFSNGFPVNRPVFSSNHNI
jgi:hypothetical protein